LEPEKVATRNIFSSHPRGANTPVRITDDNYRGGGGKKLYPISKDECKPIEQG